jgi:branched-chain amino acid transport system ATP-binding protein
MPELKLEQVDVRYGAVEALREVSMKAAPGQITVVLGANGAGKSSLVNAVCGLVPISAGAITLDGRRIDGLPPERRTRLGIALSPEGRRVFPDMSVAENLMVGGWTSSRKRRELEGGVFDFFPHLRNRRHQAAGTLSGGEQQMLAIGRAMMADPQLLVLDEPSLGLAPVVIGEIARTIVRLSQETGLTVLLSEQNAVMGLDIAQQGCVLQLGRVVAQGESGVLAADEVVKLAYLGA